MSKLEKPIRCLLFCPKCGAQHIDKGEWKDKLHHKHLCLKCGFIWRVEPYCSGVLLTKRDVKHGLFAVFGFVLLAGIFGYFAYSSLVGF